MKHINIETTVLRLIPTVYLLLAIVAIGPRHINWNPGRRNATGTQPCATQTSKPTGQAAHDCTAMIRS